MRGRILQKIIVFLLFFPLGLNGQEPSEVSPSKGNSVLTFTPAHKLKKSKQTRFRNQYYGILDGKDMELTLSEKKHHGTLALYIELTDLKNRQTYQGTKIIKPKIHQLDSLMLKDENGDEKIIESLFLHNYNPNFINLLTSEGQVGYFFWGEEPAKSDFYAKPFYSIESFKGLYDGRIDGRPAELKIEKRAEGTQIIIRDKEQKQEYWTFIDQLPQAKRAFSIGPLQLKATTSTKEIYIEELVLDKSNTQIISGNYKVKGKGVGLFFIRKSSPMPTVLPEFPWPPPKSSDFVKLELDTLEEVDRLGDVDSIIVSSLKESGFKFRPNKYFFTPNGFALVTQIEQIDCEGNPLGEVDRWSVKIPEFEKDFNLIDYLRVLSKEKEGFYRVFAFIITDDLNPLSRIDPTLEETEDWLLQGSTILPETIANQQLTDRHYCRAYVYEFSKKAGVIQAEMVKKGKNKCWKKAEIHLGNTNFFDNLNLLDIKAN